MQTYSALKIGLLVLLLLLLLLLLVIKYSSFSVWLAVLYVNFRTHVAFVQLFTW